MMFLMRRFFNTYLWRRCYQGLYVLLPVDGELIFAWLYLTKTQLLFQASPAENDICIGLLTPLIKVNHNSSV